MIANTIELAAIVALVLHAKRKGWLQATPRDRAAACVLAGLWACVILLGLHR